jgi:hypothetical protein
MAFCRFFGFTYFHTDIESLLPIDSAELRKKWSGLIIGESEPANQRPSIRPNPSTLLVFLLKLAIGQFTSNTFVLSVNHCHAFTDFFPQQIEALICDGKLKYANPKKLEVNQSAAIPSLAIHLRRGHMLPSDEGLRLTTNQMILDTLTVLTTQYGPLKTTIYSAIPDTELESMLPLGVILNSSADEFDVLHNLITADYMVMAKSSMSYVAGVFCQGIVFYEPFWHPPLSSWKKLPTRASRSEMQ